LKGVTGVAAAAPTVIDQPAAVTSATTSPKFTQTPPAAPDAAPVRPQVVAEERVSPHPSGATSRSRAPLMAAIAVIVVALAAAGAFLFTRQSDAQPAASDNPSPAPSVAPSPSVQPTVAVAPTRQPTAAANTVKTGGVDLNLASTYERSELYKEAVEVYKKYLSANPNAPDAAEVSNRLSRAQKIQGLLAIAKVELDNRDYRAARRDYSEVLMLNPESNRAKAGLSEAEAHLPRNAVPAARRPMLRRLEEGLPPRPLRRNRPGLLPRREP
jgi:tetratricopeptide (TPR) repeat protein